MTRIALRDNMPGFPYRSFLYNEPVPVNYETVHEALVTAEEFGKAYYQRMKKA